MAIHRGDRAHVRLVALTRARFACEAAGMDGVHDMGGMQGFGPVLTPGSDVAFHEDWEPRQFALSLLTALERPTIESMPADRYLKAGYYERWRWATEQLLLQDGSIAPGEIEAWEGRIRGGEPVPVRNGGPDAARAAVGSCRETWTYPPAADPLFGAGDRVRVRRMRPVVHVRCPRYVRGVAGLVRAVLGEEMLPAEGSTSTEPVYSVAFHSIDLWGATEEPAWIVTVDLWESYLEPMEVTDG